MAVNNFEKISRLLKFESEHDFYFIQIIRRPKENPGLKEGKGNRTRCVKSYYIYSKEQLESHKNEIIVLSNKDLIKMLEMKRDQKEPADHLSHLLDELMVSLEK